MSRLWKPIVLGVAIGAFLYFVPFFFFRGFLFFLLIAGLIRFFWFRRYGWGWHHRYYHNPAFTDSIRNMSAEEYEAFKKRYDYYSCYPGQPANDQKSSENKQ